MPLCCHLSPTCRCTPVWAAHWGLVRPVAGIPEVVRLLVLSVHPFGLVCPQVRPVGFRVHPFVLHEGQGLVADLRSYHVGMAMDQVHGDEHDHQRLEVVEVMAHEDADRDDQVHVQVVDYQSRHVGAAPGCVHGVDLVHQQFEVVDVEVQDDVALDVHEDGLP